MKAPDRQWTIGIDARLLHYQRGGIAQYTRQLVRELAQMENDERRRYIVLQSRKDGDTLAERPRMQRANLWTPPHNRFEQWTLPVELARWRLDLLHSPDFIPPFRGRFRRVITVHDLNFELYPQFLTAESRRYYNGQIRRAVAVADHILADSHATRDDLVRLLDVPPGKITVVWLAPNPIYRRLPPEEYGLALNKLGLDAGYILFTGTLEPRKNLPGLLAAYRALRDSQPAAPLLVLAGRRGWLYDEVFSRIEQLRLSTSVRFIENPPDQDLLALYNGAGVFVLPSFYEGFGLPVLEAMTCGAPVIAANRASLPEVAGQAARLIEPEDTAELTDALLQVLGDPALRARMIDGGYAQAARFSWAETARQTRAVYYKILFEH